MSPTKKTERSPGAPATRFAGGRLVTRVSESLPEGFVGGAAVLLGGRVGFHALGLLSGVFLARGLGPDGRGAYVAVLLWPIFLGWLATLAAQRSGLYLRARHPEYERELVATGVWVAAISGGALVVAGEMCLPWLLQGHEDWVLHLARVALLVAPALTLTDVLNSMFDGARDFRLVTVFRIGPLLCQALGFGVLLLFHDLTVTNAVWLWLLTSVGFCALQYLVVALRSGVTLRPRPIVIRESAHYAVRSYPMFVADLAASFMDQVYLVPILSAADMGLYVIATRAAIIVDVPVAIAQLLFTFVARMSPAQGVRLSQRVALIGLVVTAAIGVSLFVVAGPLIPFLYGHAFVGAIAPFRILLVGAFAIGVRKILAEGLSGMGKPQHGGAGQVVALVTLAVLLWTMVPRGGILGAVWAVALSQWVNLAVTGFLFRQERQRVIRTTPTDELGGEAHAPRRGRA
jgi:O-antigen/teichoic acid export membrane protein